MKYMLIDLAIRLDDYCATKSVKIVTGKYNLFRKLQLILVLQMQQFVQYCYPELKQRYIDIEYM